MKKVNKKTIVIVRNLFFLVTIFILVIVIVLFQKFLLMKNVVKDEIIKENTISIEDQIKRGCSRTTRLENDAEYDRALSLIYQRIAKDSRESNLQNDYFNFFPANLTNCIKIIEEDLGNDSEGYFVFAGKDIQPNYFPIIVDKNYNSSDDVITALLIVHEMTHVQQYLDELNGINLSCLEHETEAFVSQWEFYRALNIEEIQTILLKKDHQEYLLRNAQISLLSTMFDLNLESLTTGKCDVFDRVCTREYLLGKLRFLISLDPVYIKQCNL